MRYRYTFYNGTVIIRAGAYEKRALDPRLIRGVFPNPGRYSGSSHSAYFSRRRSCLYFLLRPS